MFPYARLILSVMHQIAKHEERSLVHRLRTCIMLDRSKSLYLCGKLSSMNNTSEHMLLTHHLPATPPGVVVTKPGVSSVLSASLSDKARSV